MMSDVSLVGSRARALSEQGEEELQPVNIRIKARQGRSGALAAAGKRVGAVMNNESKHGQKKKKHAAPSQPPRQAAAPQGIAGLLCMNSKARGYYMVRGGTRSCGGKQNAPDRSPTPWNAS
jgi:hypothetical protein